MAIEPAQARVAGRIERGEALTIVAVGSSSTQGGGASAPGLSYPSRLAAELKVLCQGRGKLLAMAERARLVARPRAAEELAAACIEQLEAA